jgi:hypothetical protein
MCWYNTIRNRELYESGILRQTLAYLEWYEKTTWSRMRTEDGVTTADSWFPRVAPKNVGDKLPEASVEPYMTVSSLIPLFIRSVSCIWPTP